MTERGQSGGTQASSYSVRQTAQRRFGHLPRDLWQRDIQTQRFRLCRRCLGIERRWHHRVFCPWRKERRLTCRARIGTGCAHDGSFITNIMGICPAKGNRVGNGCMYRHRNDRFKIAFDAFASFALVPCAQRCTRLLPTSSSDVLRVTLRRFGAAEGGSFVSGSDPRSATSCGRRSGRRSISLNSTSKGVLASSTSACRTRDARLSKRAVASAVLSCSEWRSPRVCVGDLVSSSSRSTSAAAGLRRVCVLSRTPTLSWATEK